MSTYAERLARETRAIAEWNGNAITRARSEWSATIYRQMRDNYRPAPSANGASIWQAIDARTCAASFRPWVHSVATVYAAQAYGRATDIGTRVMLALDDITQDTREIAFTRLSEYATDSDAIACNGTCGHDACATDLDNDAPAIIVDDAHVIGWHVTSAVRCGECARCVAKRGQCESPSAREDWMPVNRVIGASLKGAARRAFKMDAHQAVDARSAHANEYGWDSIAPAIVTDDAPTVSAIPAGVRDLVARVARATDSAGESVTSGRGISEFAGDTLAVALGYAPTARGRRSARGKLGEMMRNSD